MRLEVGKRYILRNGECVKVIREVANPDYPYVVNTKAGEEMYGHEGNFDKYEESLLDIIREADIQPPPPPVTVTPPPPTARICIARYCQNDAVDGELCPSCRFAVMNGKSLPGPGVQKETAPEPEPQTITLRGGGYEVTLRQITS